MEIKFGRNLFDITENDIVLFNGACWQLITQKVHKGWHDYSPTISKTKCEQWLKKGALYLVKESNLYTTETGKQMGMFYYKFNLDVLKTIL